MNRPSPCPKDKLVVRRFLHDTLEGMSIGPTCITQVKAALRDFTVYMG